MTASAFALLLCCVAAVVFVCGTGACDSVLTHAEIAADRSRAVEFFGAQSPTPTQFGYTVNAAGDVNGDGFDDFAISAPYDSIFASNGGAVFLVFGRSAAAWASATFEFNASDTPDPASWIKISGESAQNLGRNGIAHGDFNGDGISDLLLGTSKDLAFCVFGSSGNWSSFNVSEIGKTRQDLGFSLSGQLQGKKYVGNAGDMNGDGIEDLLVTSCDSTNPNLANVVFGQAGSTRSDFDLGAINGTNGFTLRDDTTSLGASFAMGSAGDVNGDGIADLVLGSYNHFGQIGSAYVLFARNVSASQQQQWSDSIQIDVFLDGSANGCIVNGPTTSKFFGYSTFGAGDVNADGFADIVIGSAFSMPGAWIVFGHPSPWNSPIDVQTTNGFHFKDYGSGEDWGKGSNGCAGDVNGDGIDDLVIGGYQAFGSTGIKSGAAVLLFGHSGAWPAELNRNDTVGSVGFLVDGPSPSSYFGNSVHGAGDVNGDGLADFIVGAYGSMGYAALVFGFDDHCAVCSNTTDECLVCDDGFILNGTFCKSNATISWSSSASSTAVVVVIETGNGGTVGEVAAEVAQLLGVDVGQISVVEITPGTFEVTVNNEEVAQQLVTLITQCIEEGAASQQ